MVLSVMKPGGTLGISKSVCFYPTGCSQGSSLKINPFHTGPFQDNSTFFRYVKTYPATSERLSSGITYDR